MLKNLLDTTTMKEVIQGESRGEPNRRRGEPNRRRGEPLMFSLSFVSAKCMDCGIGITPIKGNCGSLAWISDTCGQGRRVGIHSRRVSCCLHYRFNFFELAEVHEVFL
jgi:hypothetical protein